MLNFLNICKKPLKLYFCTPDSALFPHSGFMKLFDLLKLCKYRGITVKYNTAWENLNLFLKNFL
ncbi:MAG: hypothetical protein BWK80_17635 [Desulfobacteraceae bacterium IS3]|nr:MAG: hypothetical protein BWK80_17635 [Desulfobacteraceae bacterium IS3]